MSQTERETARQRAREYAIREGITATALGTPGYPAQLTSLEDAPLVVFSLGNLSLCTGKTVAIVGSREATPYGRRMARRLAGELAAHGVVVVSGLARGVDAEAHHAALDASGSTIAVMGTGVDVAYPAQHRALHERIAREGLVLSELAPSSKAHAGAFPRRNRLIAALADVTIVVEAGVRSGSLITARLAGELGRTVAAVPGPIDAEGSCGTNRLLRDGAQVITSVDDALGLLALAPRPSVAVPTEVAVTAPFTADSPERRILDALRAGPRLTDDLMGATAASPRDVLGALASLEMLGLVHVDAGGFVNRA